MGFAAPSSVSDVLAFARNDLLAKGFIDQPLLTWCGRHAGFGKFEQTLLGIRGGALMILPMINIQTFKYDEVRYYAKSDIRDMKFQFGVTSVLIIELKGGGKDKYNIYGVSDGAQNIQTIMSALGFSAGLFSLFVPPKENRPAEENNNVGQKGTTDYFANAKNELSARGLIDQNLLLSWGSYKVRSLFKHQWLFFGMKGDALMILPCANVQTFLFNEVRYFTKEDIREIGCSPKGDALLLKIKFSDKCAAEYIDKKTTEYDVYQVGESLSNMYKIVSILSQR